MTEAEMTEVENVVRRAVGVLMALRLETVERLAEATGIPKSTLYRRLRSKSLQQSFLAHEVAAIAAHYKVTTDDIYSGLSGLVRDDLVASGDRATRLYRGSARHLRLVRAA